MHIMHYLELAESSLLELDEFTDGVVIGFCSYDFGLKNVLLTLVRYFVYPVIAFMINFVNR